MTFRARWVIGLVVLTAGVLLLMWLTRDGRPSAEQLFRSALEDVDAGRLDQAHQAVSALRRTSTDDPRADLLSAVILVRGGELQLGLSALARLDQEGPDRPLILQFIGEALYGLGRFGEAERFFGTLAAEQPDNAEALRWLASTYYDLGAWNAAITAMTEVTRLDPDDYRPHRLLGLMYSDFELADEAIGHYRSALERDPPPDIARGVTLELASALVTLHEYSEAKSLLDSAAVTVEAAALHAACEWNLGRADAAREWIARAEQNGPLDAAALVLKSELLEAADQNSEAETLLREAVARFPHDAALRYRLANVLQRLGKDDEAAEQFVVWEKERDLAARLTELNLKAIEDKDDPAVRDALAEVCEQLEKFELAAMWRTAAAALRRTAQEADEGPGSDATVP